MSEIPPDAPDARPPEVRFLKILVTVLTATMIAGLVTIIALLVIRLPGGGGTGAAPGVTYRLPPTLALPEGVRPAAVSFTATGQIVILTETDDPARPGTVLLYGADGALRGQAELRAP